MCEGGCLVVAAGRVVAPVTVSGVEAQPAAVGFAPFVAAIRTWASEGGFVAGGSDAHAAEAFRRVRGSHALARAAELWCAMSCERDVLCYRRRSWVSAVRRLIGRYFLIVSKVRMRSIPNDNGGNDSKKNDAEEHGGFHFIIIAKLN